MTSTERREARYRRRKAERTEKRHQKLSQYDTFEHIVDTDNLYRAFSKSMQGVAWKESVQRYEANALRNIMESRRKLLAGESVQGGFVEFTLHERGKVRHIKSVHISERIVQKCLCDEVLVPILSHSLIYDNGASVKGKGVHFAIRRFILHLTQFYRQHNTNMGYALLIDFSKFFDNVDHEILFELINQKIKDPRIRELIRGFIMVFGAGKSLGLGSQVSQICAIFYPDQLDHLIKEQLRIHYYGRYMDDMYLIHNDKEYLKQCLKEIRVCCEKLKIIINMKKTRIVKLSQGVEFLKGTYRLLQSGKVLCRPGKESTNRMKRKLKRFKVLLDEKKMSYHDVRTSYQSWRGNFKKRFHAYHRVHFMDKLYYDLFIANRNNNSNGR